MENYELLPSCYLGNATGCQRNKVSRGTPFPCVLASRKFELTEQLEVTILKCSQAFRIVIVIVIIVVTSVIVGVAMSTVSNSLDLSVREHSDPAAHNQSAALPASS
jgi:hypothetical protein